MPEARCTAELATAARMDGCAAAAAPTAPTRDAGGDADDAEEATADGVAAAFTSKYSTTMNTMSTGRWTVEGLPTR